MKMRIVLPIVLAVVAGLGCLVVIRQVLDDPSRRPERMVTQQVVIAAAALAPGQTLDAKMIQMKEVPAGMVPKEHFKAPDVQKLIGRMIRANVLAGYPLTPDALEAEGGPLGLAKTIPPGYRACTIKVDEWSSVAGFVLPGSRVDVVAQVKAQDTKVARSRTILQNVEVASVGSAVVGEDQQTDRVGTGDRRSVTLYLTPRDAEVVYDPRHTRLTLLLRGINDTSRHETVEELVSANQVAQVAPVGTTPGKPGEGRMVGPDKYITFEIHGDHVIEVIYVRVNGMWLRENSENHYNQGGPVESTPLPEVKTNPDGSQPVAKQDSGDDKDEEDSQEQEENESEDDIDE